MSDKMAQTGTPQDPQSLRRPYEQPTLRVFGSVSAITSAFSRDMGAMDGGPNNLKT